MKRPPLETLLTEPRKMSSDEMHQLVLWALHVEELQRPSDRTLVLDHGPWSLFYQLCAGENVLWVSIHQKSGEVVVHKVAASWRQQTGWRIDASVAPLETTKEAINQLQGKVIYGTG